MPLPFNILDEHFRLLFESAPGSFLVVLPDPEFTIVGVTDDYLRDTLTEREAILGKGLFEVFPDNPATPAANATQNLRASLQRVVATKTTDTMPIQRYDVPRPDGNGFEVRYWSPVNRPVLCVASELLCIIHRVQNVTDYMRLVEETELRQRQSAQLTAQNQKMEAEILQRSRELDLANRELRRANEALSQHAQQVREEARRKDEFLAMLAHELRNPLAPIAAAAELLQLPGLDQDRVRQTSSVIARQVEHMTELVDDLLDVSGVTRGLVTLQEETLNVDELITDAVEQARSLLQAKAHRFVVQMPDERFRVRGDRTRLVQVLANIVNNAAKYTPPHGDITLRLAGNEMQVEIAVEDNGIGIAPSLLPHVFEPFTQGERAPDRLQGGLGLGLALVKTLVELQGGTVAAHSDGAGKGSRFVVHLPRAGMQDADAERQAGRNELPRSAGRMRLMVVDDNRDAAQTLSMLLETTGHEVAVSHSAEDALAAAQRTAPAILFLDIGLPDMDGYELARRLRRLPQTADALLVAVTGYGQPEDRARALQAGFDHHLVKPVKLTAVLALLATLDCATASPAMPTAGTSTQ